ncbi:hypothetical protein HYV44_00915 [Candidatus Microgenomates bacterium]|nr:hypothetical protein [Candidatus Microgenomates bacterium]
MNIYRCTICGEASIAEKRPSDCPLCGAKKRYIKELEKVKGDDLFVVKKLSDESKKNLLLALNMETYNASFYKCASVNGDVETVKAVFKRLAKVAREHADIARKFLGLDPIILQEEECSLVSAENLQKAAVRCLEAVEFYKKAATEARESKISTFFKAMIDAEEEGGIVAKKMLNSGNQ